MKKQLLITLAALIILTLIGISTTTAQPQMGDRAGRYQMYTGEAYDVAIKQNRPFVFRMDTQTGDTWVFQAGLDRDEKRAYRWIPIDPR